MPKTAYDQIAVLEQARKRRKELIKMKAAGKSLAEVAAIWNISRQRVSEIWRAAKREAGIA